MYASHRRRKAFQDPDVVHQAFDGTLTFALILLVLILLCVLALLGAATR